MATKDLLEIYLAQNLTPAQAAAACGVSESYVHKLMEDEDFVARVSAQKQELAEKDGKFDDLMDDTEATLLGNISKRAQFAGMKESLMAFRILNGARRRRESKNAPPAQIGAIVQITLPASLAPQYVLNNKREIVEVEGRTMIAATPDRVDEIVRTNHPELAQRMTQEVISTVEAIRHPSQRPALVSAAPRSGSGSAGLVTPDLI
jgi:hypothetical protein